MKEMTQRDVKTIYIIVFAVLVLWSYCKLKPIKQHVFVTFVAAGRSSRKASIIKNNIDLLMDNVQKYGLNVECQILAYAKFKDLPPWMTDENSEYSQFCPVTVFHKGTYVYFLKTLQPTLLRQAGFDYLFLILDDVALYKPFGYFDLGIFLRLMKTHNLFMASPGITNSVWNAMTPQRHAFSSGRYASMIEIQATVFNMDSWKCIYELLDTEFPSGWGIDLWYYDYCIRQNRISTRSIGIIDIFQGAHDPFEEAVPNNKSKAIMVAQELSWLKQRNLKLVRTEMQTLGRF
jgi:hypothetical protein